MKTALVTGGTRGIGSAIADSLQAGGYDVLRLGRKMACLASEESIRQFAGKFLADRPKLDLLIHAAGVIELGEISLQGTESLAHQYEVNLRAPYLLTQLMISALKEAQGQIVFVNSTAALRSSSKNAQYAATKAGLRVIADAFRDDLNPCGVRVLSLFLGRTATDMQAPIFQEEKRAYVPEKLMQPEDVALATMCALNLPRTAEITEITMRPMQKLGESKLED
jgi:short-subunit dehydrogenase